PHFNYFPNMMPYKRVLVVLPIALLAAISLYIGFAAEHVQILSERIAMELLDTKSYIRAVLP
ncbi:hypothetical protein RZS08_30090, partial [Arthrospira platensis SPKY1]|nr:hypothetical protein [Arthrospira platensis SPKY1]